MDNDKGKGRAVNPANSNKSPAIDLHSHSSILDRVTASATGLAQSVFSAPTRNEISDATSTALASSGKGRQISGSSTSQAESSYAYKQNGLQTPQEQPLTSMKAGHIEEHVRAAESEFSSFLDGTDSFTPSVEPFIKADLQNGRALDTTEEGASARNDKYSDKFEQLQYYSVYKQQQHDGDAVLSILSRPSVMTDELEASPPKDGEFDWGLTDEQISRLRTLMDESFPAPSQHKSVPVEHQLNLLPSMVLAPSTSDPAPFMETTLGDYYMYFGDIPRDRAMQIWMEQWEGVLTRYSDEVWGNLLPLVIEAREEVKGIKEEHSGTSVQQLKALRRLRLLLDHVRRL